MEASSVEWGLFICSRNRERLYCARLFQASDLTTQFLLWSSLSRVSEGAGIM